MIDLLCPASSLAVRPTTAPLSPAFDWLFAELDRSPGFPTLACIERSLGAAPLDLADVLPHTAIDRATYVRTLVRSTARYQALVMCWLPGQLSPVHDHGGSACGVRVIQGAATETVYTIADDGFADPASRRVYCPGDVVCAADADVHTLGNLPILDREPWPVALVTVHIYAPALTNGRKYLERDISIAAARGA